MANVRYVTRHRERHRDSLLHRVVAWAVYVLVTIRNDVAYLGLPAELPRAVATLISLTERVRTPATVTRHEIDAVRRMGPPWNDFAEIVRQLIDLLEDPERYAYELIAPDQAWRLFHLGVYGELLCALLDQHWKVTAHAPLRDYGKTPAHRAQHQDGRTAELWFEADGVWHAYQATPPQPLIHTKATAAVHLHTRLLRPDCVIMIHDAAGNLNDVVVIEAKFGDAGYLAHSGFTEALQYGIELRALTNQPTLSLAVGPASVITGTSTATVTTDGAPVRVGACEPAAIAPLIAPLL